MLDRPALFLRLEDEDGAFGFGEVWCNFPSCGAEHRARLLATDLADLAFAMDDVQPGDVLPALTQKTHRRAIQSAEAGPYAQGIAGLDMASWDLAARLRGKPVRLLLNEKAAERMPTYASGIDIREADEVMPRCRGEGYKAFKVKVGFDPKKEPDRLKELASGLDEHERLFTDANQAWELDEALEFVKELEAGTVDWLEEPLPADSSLESWRRLADASPVPLAGGENLIGEDQFRAAIGSECLGYMQPDIAKWGGFTGCFGVARQALAAGGTYCPHYLGGGIGLIASAHLLAAAGGPGLLEVDANPNPLRDAFLSEDQMPGDGNFHLGSADGLGIEELPDSLAPYEVMHLHATR